MKLNLIMELLAALKGISLVRWLRMLVGLWVFGIGDALMVNARVGLSPWTVFAEGLSKLTGWQLGTITILVGATVLGLWVFINEKPGVATLCNIVLIGTAINTMLPLLPMPDALPQRVLEMLVGVLVVGTGGALYLSAELGTGPRDGLMMGLARKSGWSVRVARMIIEVTVLALGWLLGGTVGIGTVAFALGIGPVLQFMLKLMGAQLAAAPTLTPEPAK